MFIVIYVTCESILKGREKFGVYSVYSTVGDVSTGCSSKTFR